MRNQADFLRSVCEEKHSKQCLDRLENNFMSMSGDVLPTGRIPDIVKVLLPDLAKKHF